MQHVAELLLEQQEGRGVDRDDRVHVLDEVTQVGVVGLAHRGVQRHRLASQALNLDDLGSREVQGCAELLRGRLTTELLEQLALQPAHLVDRLDHVDGDADGAGLVGDRPGDGLTDPPRGVRRELETTYVVEFLDRADQPEVALLDQVEEEHPPTDVALGDRHDQAQVGLDQVPLGQHPRDGDRLQVPLEGLGQPGVREPLRREQPRLHGLGQLDLLRGRQQRDLADLLEVEPDRVAGRTRLGGLVLLAPLPRLPLGLLGRALGLGVQDGDTGCLQRQEHPVQGLRRQVAGHQGELDLLEPERPRLPAACDQRQHLLRTGREGDLLGLRDGRQRGHDSLRPCTAGRPARLTRRRSRARAAPVRSARG